MLVLMIFVVPRFRQVFDGFDEWVAEPSSAVVYLWHQRGGEESCVELAWRQRDGGFWLWALRKDEMGTIGFDNSSW